MEALSRIAAQVPGAHALDREGNRLPPGYYYGFREVEKPKPTPYKKASRSRVVGQPGKPLPEPKTTHNGRPIIKFSGSNDPEFDEPRVPPPAPTSGYHGSPNKIQPGEYIIPVNEGASSRFEEMYKNHPEISDYANWTFFTPHLDVATQDYSHGGKAGVRGHVYRVEPEGRVIPDTTLDEGFAWMAPRLRVISEVQFNPKTKDFEEES